MIIINTCGFIEAAKKESIEAILNLAQYKDQGACRALIAVGCMTEKYADEMCEAIPELDAVAGSRDYELIADLVNKTIGLDQAEQTVPPSNCFLLRDLDFSSASAYLKIAEGCDNCCSYCLIPQLRGPLRSRPMADILEEAQFLYDKGIRELNVIAQDTTAYGCDTHGKSLLAELMEQLAQIPFVMIRLLYVYPDSVNDELLQVMATHDNICHYLDIPVQHGCDKILAAMNRHSSRQGILDSLARIRKWLPDVVLRSTLKNCWIFCSRHSLTGWVYSHIIRKRILRQQLLRINWIAI